jgi:hypothetical protein
MKISSWTVLVMVMIMDTTDTVATEAATEAATDAVEDVEG